MSKETSTEQRKQRKQTGPKTVEEAVPTTDDEILASDDTGKTAKTAKTDKKTDKAEPKKTTVGKGRCVIKMAAGFGVTFSVVLVVAHVMGWTKAIPWGFGGQSEENKTGRVPEFDKFLNDNAKLLGEHKEVRKIIPKFIELSKTITTDSECTQYYTTVLMKIGELGLDNAMAREREGLNRQIASSMSMNADVSLGYVMKKRHILDAFVDAASLHAWPTIRAQLRQEL